MACYPTVKPSDPARLARISDGGRFRFLAVFETIVRRALFGVRGNRTMAIRV